MAEKFDVLTVELQGSKLIEASAGTGKTYSIAILGLRLIIEKKIPIEKILMVTFTNTAVAELESRVRKFVRLAYKFASGKAIDEPTISEAVGIPTEEKIELLRSAVQSLDSLSVMTIHSFCQKTIGELTFETDQSFEYEIVRDDSLILDELVNVYRREVVNTIDDYEWFKKINSYLKFDKMAVILKNCLEEKTFLDIDLSKTQDINETIIQTNYAFDELEKQVFLSFEEIKTTKVHGGSRLAKNRESHEQFLPVFIQECCFAKKYTSEFSFLYEPYGRNYAENYQKVEHCFYATFINSAKVTIHKIKQEKGYISYDDQIKTIHKALGNESFKEKLSKKFEAVFIDEFQDTDKYQYEIFNRVFSKNSIVFYIGDPKQSIYGWRSADLDTYKLAKINVNGSVFSMNKNFRSTKKMIDALNILLNPGESYNMFMDDEIRYINVNEGVLGLGEMKDHENEVLPITIWEFDENDHETNYKAVAQEIYRLLTEDVKIKNRRISPKDIGILVRDNKEGDSIKKWLAALNIPSVKRDTAKVFESDESELIKNLLIAVISPNRGDINRALNSPYFGFNTESLKTIYDEIHIDVFIKLRKTLIDEGVYNMISSFLNNYDVRSYCMKDVLGQRVLTNINQIAEILHKVEKQLKYTPEELLVWMGRRKDENDEEYEQRVESDDDAVQISTIHKAKGLEYNIVFAPCLSMIPKKKFLEAGNVNDFKKEGEYFFTLNYPDLSEEDKNDFVNQKEQENRRLIYVALTRAIYKCYISLVPRAYKNVSCPSSLSEILDNYHKNSELIEIDKVPKDTFVKIEGRYEHRNDDHKFSPKTISGIEIKNTFGIHSFSALSKAHHSAPFEKAELGTPDNYNQFIFQDLGRGANVGTALHSIFEHLDFNDSATWTQTLADASKYYPNIIKEESRDLFMQMTKHIMNTEIDCNGEKFALNKLTNGQKLPELEFCFSMSKVNKTKINEILEDEADLNGEADIEGLMAGFIDLLFEHNGKYYILDWKSNHLGNSTENYYRKNLEEAMKGSNYNLQYMIYTIAAKRWLESRIKNFDYNKQFGGIIYVFLRGVREGLETGIYTAKPKLEKIESMEKLLKH